MVKYLSDKTNKIYNSLEELEAAEKEFEERENAEKIKQAQRKERAQEVRDAYNKYQELLKKFFKDYGYYYEVKDGSEFDLAKLIFDWPFGF